MLQQDFNCRSNLQDTRQSEQQEEHENTLGINKLFIFIHKLKHAAAYDVGTQIIRHGQINKRKK